MRVALDDTSRVSFSSIHPNENADSACRALLAALRYFETFGISFRRVMADTSWRFADRLVRFDPNRFGPEVRTGSWVRSNR